MWVLFIVSTLRIFYLDWFFIYTSFSSNLRTFPYKMKTTTFVLAAMSCGRIANELCFLIQIKYILRCDECIWEMYMMGICGSGCMYTVHVCFGMILCACVLASTDILYSIFLYYLVSVCTLYPNCIANVTVILVLLGPLVSINPAPRACAQFVASHLLVYLYFISIYEILLWFFPFLRTILPTVDESEIY